MQNRAREKLQGCYAYNVKILDPAVMQMILGHEPDQTYRNSSCQALGGELDYIVAGQIPSSLVSSLPAHLI